jgi:DNA-binding LacI/PurR family transcriptional regulator
MSTAVLQVLARSGRRVPDDVAVVGFDDSAPARMTTPQLTTVRQPVERLAAQALRTLLQPEEQRLSRSRRPRSVSCGLLGDILRPAGSRP